MRNDFESNYLMHHGILGQKWGHKNGPPYPLDSKDHSSSEKKAGWRKSLTGKIQEHRRKKKEFKEDQYKYDVTRKNMVQADYRRRMHQKKANDQSEGRMIRETEEDLALMADRDYKEQKKLCDSLVKKYGDMKIMDKHSKDSISAYEKMIKEELLDKYEEPIKTVASDYEGKTYKKGSTEELRSRPWGDLEKEISKKSGSWYFGEGVSPAFKKEIKRHKKVMDELDKKQNSKRYNSSSEASEERRKYLDNLSGIVLKDLGYPDTKENREYLKRSHVIDWD